MAKRGKQPKTVTLTEPKKRSGCSRRVWYIVGGYFLICGLLYSFSLNRRFVNITVTPSQNATRTVAAAIASENRQATVRPTRTPVTGITTERSPTLTISAQTLVGVLVSQNTPTVIATNTAEPAARTLNSATEDISIGLEDTYVSNSFVEEVSLVAVLPFQQNFLLIDAELRVTSGSANETNANILRMQAEQQFSDKEIFQFAVTLDDGTRVIDFAWDTDENEWIIAEIDVSSR